MVVEEAVRGIPHTAGADAVGDVDEVLEELGGHGLVHLVLRRQPQRHSQHHQAVERHPRGTVGLFNDVARGHMRPVDRSDVVEAKEAALKDVVAFLIDPIDPPGEVDGQFVEDPLEEVEVISPADLKHSQRRPGMNGGIEVIK